ncbi:MAG TPA: SRPBCC domain-containing protein, partial [Acidimicrobiia bacterium]|nr:SRPBCC domain-containing protein [Acidimicrobiia bacterium]
WDGQPYQDKGTVRDVHPPQVLEYSHFSPLTGLPDVPENYHNVRIEVVEDGPATRVTLIQDNNDTDETKDHSEGNWQTMLDGLKEVVERDSA